MTIQRFENWPLLLERHIKETREKPFVWGLTDCCLWAGDAVKAMTGTDLCAFARGKYKTRTGALSLLKRYADGTILGIVIAQTKQFGLEEVPVNFAQRGDIVYLGEDEGGAVGIVGLDGRSGFVFTEKFGFTQLPLFAFKRAWRVD